MLSFPPTNRSQSPPDGKESLLSIYLSIMHKTKLLALCIVFVSMLVNTKKRRQIRSQFKVTTKLIK